jgi:uncharacterized protein (TIGR02271 family)
LSNVDQTGDKGPANGLAGLKHTSSNPGLPSSEAQSAVTNIDNQIGRDDPHGIEGAVGEEVRIPLVEEQIAVGKREVETGRVHVRTHVEEKRETLTEMLERDVVDVERVPMNIEVPTPPQPFEDEYGVYVVPIVEEQVVVEKRLFVVEELRIRRRHSSAPVEIPVTRRVMRAVIDRNDTQADARSGDQRDANDPLSSSIQGE